MQADPSFWLVRVDAAHPVVGYKFPHGTSLEAVVRKTPSPAPNLSSVPYAPVV